MEQCLIKCGLWAVFFGSAVESDAIPVISGAVSHLGAFGFAAAGAASIFGMFTGDCAWYAFGRLFGDTIKRFGIVKKRMPAIDLFIERYGIWQLLFARILYGTRNATMLIWGIRKSGFLRFAVIDLIGCTVWGGLLISFGYFLSFSLSRTLGDIRETEIFLLIVGLVVVVLIFLRKILMGRNVKKNA